MSQISRLRDAEISNGNLINADDLDAEFDGLVSESNSQDTRLTTLETGDYTQSGNVTFSNAPKTNTISERTADTGVTIDSVLLKDGMATVSGTPASAGEIGYASNTLQYYNGTSVISLGDTITAVNARSSNTIWAGSDKGALFVCTSTFTQTITAAATLGEKWFCLVRNGGPGIITLDPDSSETIDGAATVNLYPGESCIVICDGSNFSTIGRSTGLVLIQSQTASSVSAVDFTTGITSEFDEYELHYTGAVPATDAVDLWLRVSEDAGSNWKSGSTDYYYNVGFLNASTALGNDNTANAAQALILRDVPNSGGKCEGVVRINQPASSAFNKGFIVDGLVVGSGPERSWGYAEYKGTTNAITGLRLLFSSGNITSGSFKLYGVRK